MKIRSPYKIRLYIKVTIDGKTYASTIKDRVLSFAQRELSGKRKVKGRCTVLYNGKKNLYNQFSFSDQKEFDRALSADTELSLLRYIDSGVW